MGREEGERIARDRGLYKSMEDLARLAAQRGAVVGAKLGAKVMSLGVS